MHRISTVLAAVATTAVVVAPTAAWAAQPQGVRCGSTVTRSVTLTKDLVCPGNGITLTGQAVLDLGGHTLTARTGTAVLIATGSDATVRNGSIADSPTAIASADDRDSPPQYRQLTVSRVTVKRNGNGIRLGNTDAMITNSHFKRNREALFGSLGGTAVVSGSSFTNNEHAVHVDTAGVSITRSYLGHNGTGLTCVEANPCSLIKSRVQGTAIGVSINKAPLWMREVTITGSDRGIVAADGFGLDVAGSTFTANTVGADLFFVQAVFARNTFRGNDTAITVSAQSGGGTATFTANRFVRNGDGLVTDGSEDILIGRNRAVRNAGWGIYAPNATDLGGNRASGNGNDPQCVGVVCTP